MKQINLNHQPIYNKEELFNALMRGLDIDKSVLDEPDADLNYVVARDGIELADLPLFSDRSIDSRLETWLFKVTKDDCDSLLLRLMDKCPHDEEKEYLALEWEQWDKRGLCPILLWIELLVAHSKSVGVPLGVGRGSSVASYALFLIGLHKINPLKYGLNISEYFKE